jgi:putative oxidoreductase
MGNHWTLPAPFGLASRTKNWFGNQKGERFEYHLLTLALAIPIMIRGAGAFSIDRALSNKSTA